ncbi:MAG: tetratricopeptide repeat protein [Kiritimatiellia bacterium]|nr:tetratricopeptide repeat protein [Kiritimatiellia bacterium]
MKPVCRILILFCLATAPALALDVEERLQFADGLYTRGMYGLAVKEYTAIMDANPGADFEDRLYFRRGECYRHIGQLVAAEKDFRRVFTQYPKSEFKFRAGYRRADLFMDAGQFQAAIELYQVTLKAHPPEEVASACLYFLGEALLKSGDNEKAVKTFEQLRITHAGSKFDSYALLKLGDLYARELDDGKKAMSLYKEAADKPVSDRVGAEALFQMAEMYFEKEEFDKSAEAYAKLMSRYPKDPRASEARLQAGWAAHNSGKYAEALRYVTAAIEEGGLEDASHWLYLKANCERQLMKSEEAVATYKSLLSDHKESVFLDAAQYEQALTYHKMGRFDKAVKAASRVDISGSLAKDVYWLLAESYSSLNQENEAIQYYRLLAREFPESKMAGDATYRLAHHLQANKEYKEASRFFSQVAANFPDSELAPQALFASAFCLQKVGMHEEAARDWATLITKYPSHMLCENSTYQKAMSEIRLQRGEDARGSLRQLLDKYPATKFKTDAHYWLGMLLREIDRTEDAKTELGLCLKASPRPDLKREAEFGLALVLESLGDASTSAKMLQDLLKSPAREKFTRPLLQWLSEFQLNQGKNREGIDAARLLVEEQNEPVWVQTGWCLIGRGQLAQGDKTAATEAFNRALSTRASTRFAAESALRLGELAAAEAGKVKAMGYFQKAAALAGDDSQLAIRARAYAGMGRVASAESDHESAARYFMSVAILYDDAKLVPECLLGAAEAFKKAGNEEAAQQAMAELKQRYPDAASGSQTKTNSTAPAAGT